MRVFGQEDRVRIYGWDILDRLREAGFEHVDRPDLYATYTPEQQQRLGLRHKPTIVAYARASSPASAPAAERSSAPSRG